MKALRRSIKGDKDKPSPASIAHKSALAIVPPKKVIRALYDYEARSEQELSFSRGDFFHVIGREDDTDWYEACNPALPDARGLVPVAFFQALGRTERDSGHSDSMRAPQSAPLKSPDHDSGYSDSQGPVMTQRQSQAGRSGPMVYGVVMFDFNAERSDELNAKAGEAIIVIAQSNPEWFVAKPIGRLGGPGLIPVSFVEIRDMASDKAIENPAEAIRKAGVPKVEEWKKMAAEYKNSSITLGKFEVGGNNQGQPMEQAMERMSIQPNGRQSSQQSMQLQQQTSRTSQRSTQGHQYQQPAQQPGQQPAQQSQQDEYSNKSTSQLYAPISARIPRYCFAEEKYWFVIEAMLEDGRHWELSRYYEDFYDFQIALLTEFPAEAGNTGQQKRTLPYMPGPVNYVTDAITEGRLHNLDAYVKNLLNQPPYISRCLLVKQFFAPREGDYEIDLQEAGGEYRLSQGSQMSSNESPAGTSAQSSRNNLNGGGYGGLSATPRQLGGSQQSLQQQTSQTTVAAMKIKIKFNGDLIAIRVPTDVQYAQLHDRIRERLKVQAGDQLQLFYQDEASGDKPNLMSDNDLYYALQRNEKLMLFAEVT